MAASVLETWGGPHSAPADSAMALPEVTGLLARIEGELRALIGSTEEEFLGIGARLQSFHERAGDIAQMATEITTLAAGDEVVGGIESLERILERMRFYLKSAAQKSDLSTTMLKEILERLDEVEDPLSGFRKINKVLRMLGISTRIESTRLAEGGEEFGTLANDVEQLYLQINEKAAAVHEHKKSLSASIRQTLDGVRSAAAAQHANAETMLSKAMASLAVLRDVNSNCSGVADSIGTSSREVAGNIAAVVTSMQFHDITRQQMEHAAEALSEIGERAGAQDGAAGNGGGWGILAGEVADVCELQGAQLAHALHELGSAVEKIMSSLHGIAEKEEMISAAIREMAGAADKTGGSFFTEMEEGLAGVAAVLNRSAAENRDLAAALDTMAGTVAEISTFVDAIETIGEEIELIALNAQIKAARTGEEGAALGVLAEAIQRLAVDARRQTCSISGILRGINDASSGLSSEVDAETSTLESEVRELVGGLGSLLQTLGRISGSLMSLLGRLDASVAALDAEIEAAISGVTVHQRCSSVLSKAMEELAGIVCSVRRIAPAGRNGGQARLDGHSGRYSMQSERQVHEAVTGSKGNAELPAVSVPAALAEASTGEFGDNVELF